MPDQSDFIPVRCPRCGYEARAASAACPNCYGPLPPPPPRPPEPEAPPAEEPVVSEPVAAEEEQPAPAAEAPAQAESALIPTPTPGAFTGFVLGDAPKIEVPEFEEPAAVEEAPPVEPEVAAEEPREPFDIGDFAHPEPAIPEAAEPPVEPVQEAQPAEPAPIDLSETPAPIVEAPSDIAGEPAAEEPSPNWVPYDFPVLDEPIPAQPTEPVPEPKQVEQFIIEEPRVDLSDHAVTEPETVVDDAGRFGTFDIAPEPPALEEAEPTPFDLSTKPGVEFEAPVVEEAVESAPTSPIENPTYEPVAEVEEDRQPFDLADFSAPVEEPVVEETPFIEHSASEPLDPRAFGGQTGEPPVVEEEAEPITEAAPLEISEKRPEEPEAAHHVIPSWVTEFEKLGDLPEEDFPEFSYPEAAPPAEPVVPVVTEQPEPACEQPSVFETQESLEPEETVEEQAESMWAPLDLTESTSTEEDQPIIEAEAVGAPSELEERAPEAPRRDLASEEPLTGFVVDEPAEPNETLEIGVEQPEYDFGAPVEVEAPTAEFEEGVAAPESVLEEKSVIAEPSGAEDIAVFETIVEPASPETTPEVEELAGAFAAPFTLDEEHEEIPELRMPPMPPEQVAAVQKEFITIPAKVGMAVAIKTALIAAAVKAVTLGKAAGAGAILVVKAGIVIVARALIGTVRGMGKVLGVVVGKAVGLVLGRRRREPLVTPPPVAPAPEPAVYAPVEEPTSIGEFEQGMLDRLAPAGRIRAWADELAAINLETEGMITELADSSTSEQASALIESIRSALSEDAHRAGDVKDNPYSLYWTLWLKDEREILAADLAALAESPDPSLDALRSRILEIRSKYQDLDPAFYEHFGSLVLLYDLYPPETVADLARKRGASRCGRSLS